MFHKVLKDESGMVLGLAIIMIVLIGVMGAGLLVFVRSDLEAVVEVNQGQRAFETADAGVQAAKRQLLSDATEASYDSNTGSNSDWAYVGGPGGPGKNLTFSANTVNIKIQYLLPSDNPSELTNANHAPELVPSGQTDYPEPKDYFKVTSEGTTGEARRKIEAIFSTYDLGVPKAYFTPENITINGSACVKNVSLFSLGDIRFTGQGGCVLPGGGKTHMQGTDTTYGNWQNSFNITPRTRTDAGVGTVGSVNGKVAGRDYDEDGTTSGTISSSNPKFVKDVSSGGQTSSEITFPFDYKTQLVSGEADKERLAFLEEEARLQEAATGQDNYREIGGTNPSLSTWPSGSDYGTVVYVRLTGSNPGTLKWDVPGDCTASSSKKGILVVENGNFTTQPNKALFSGAIIVRGGVIEDGEYSDSGNTCLEGFANANGEITISGSANPSFSPDLSSSPGFYKVRLWSWRELYQ